MFLVISIFYAIHSLIKPAKIMPLSLVKNPITNFSNNNTDTTIILISDLYKTTNFLIVLYIKQVNIKNCQNQQKLIYNL